MSHYCIFLLYHLIMRRRDEASTCMADDAHAAAFACAPYMWQVDGSPWRRTPPVIRTQMALQWLIIDAANMWQLLINTHAGWMLQKRTALMIHLKPRGGKVRRRERKGRGEENDTLAAKVCPPYTIWHLCGVRMTGMNCLNNAGASQVKERDGEERYSARVSSYCKSK